jgi:DNA topoisomerase-1
MKRGRFGQFLACTGYPECKTTRKIQKGGAIAAPTVQLEELCPQCGKHLVIKQGRFGPFTACSNYPECKYIKQDTTGVACPEDGGDIVAKRGKRKSFYGCSNYPKCNFVLWDKPVAKSCPQCAARFLVEKWKKDGSRELQCRTEDCKYKEDVIETEAPTETVEGSHVTA